MFRANLGTVRASSLRLCRMPPLLLTGFFALFLGTIGNSGGLLQKEEIKKATLLRVSKDPVSEVNDTVVAGGTETQQFSANSNNNNVERTEEQTESFISQEPQIITREVELAKGGNFVDMLMEAEVSAEEAQSAFVAFNKIYNHKKLRAGQEITLTFSKVGEEERLLSVTFQPEDTKEISIVRESDGSFSGRVNITPLERKRFAVKAEIRSSLYETGDKNGIPRSVMAAILRAYSHTVDFQRDIHPGDKLEVLYDQPVNKEGNPTGQGVIIYASLELKGKKKQLYRVTFADGTVDYFDEQGKSIKQALLRTPIDGVRVTSGFGVRRHPLLGYSKMHQGVDFGAPTGTPIFAAGEGIVEEVGFKGSYGRFILLRHNGKIKTAYAHMSRFSRNVYPGAKVKQGDVIGFVGSSGRSTGPHLHYEVRVNNRQVNPLNLNLPVGKVLEGKLLVQFKEGQKKIQKDFASLLDGDNTKNIAQDSERQKLVKASAHETVAKEKPSVSCGLRGGC